MRIAPSPSFAVTVGLLVVSLQLLLASAAPSDNKHGDPKKDDTTTTSDPLTSSSPTDAVNRHHGRDRPIHVEPVTWGYGPIVTVAVFGIFMLMSRKLAVLGGVSPRLWLCHFISIETLYNTLAGATKHHYDEQWRVEVGHQVFMLMGVAFLSASFLVNSKADNDQPTAFYVLQIVQMALLLFNVLFDTVLIRRGHLRPVRSLNTKLRFAHSTYQVFLFCTDVLSGGLTSLPVDCYIWATVHYFYESVGLLVEGLNVIGMSDMAIIIFVNVKAMSNTTSATGPVAGFGLTCLGLSCLSIVGGVLWKAFDADRQPRFDPTTAPHGDEEEELTHTPDHSDTCTTANEASVRVAPPSGPRSHGHDTTIPNE